uniref:Ig-like domain-containing protein n=1 Tax=Salmo trutta TaxID=8032 RepID=A0A673ZS11_SALTR
MEVLLLQTQTRLYTSNHNLWILLHTQLVSCVCAERPVAVLILQPNWTKIFRGETVTMRCDIQGGGDTDWDYRWIKNSQSFRPFHTKPDHRISPVYRSNSGSDTCEGVKGNKLSNINDAVQLTVSGKSI